MKDWSKNQRQLMAEFLSNTAVLVIGLGLINPLFFPVKDIVQLIKQIVMAVIVILVLLINAFVLIKENGATD